MAEKPIVHHIKASKIYAQTIIILQHYGSRNYWQCVILPRMIRFSTPSSVNTNQVERVFENCSQNSSKLFPSTNRLYVYINKPSGSTLMVHRTLSMSKISSPTNRNIHSFRLTICTVKIICKFRIV